jgi:hypothetical protein
MQPETSTQKKKKQPVKQINILKQSYSDFHAEHVDPYQPTDTEADTVCQFPALAPALQHATDTPGRHTFAYEYGSTNRHNKAERCMRTISYRGLAALFEESDRNDICYHEYMLPDRPTKIYMDIDIDRRNMQEMDFVSSLYWIVQVLCGYLKASFAKDDIEANFDPIKDFYYLYACTPTKYSAHIVMKKSDGCVVVVENKRALGHFMKMFSLMLIMTEIDIWKAARDGSPTDDLPRISSMKLEECNIDIDSFLKTVREKQDREKRRKYMETLAERGTISHKSSFSQQQQQAASGPPTMDDRSDTITEKELGMGRCEDVLCFEDVVEHLFADTKDMVLENEHTLGQFVGTVTPEDEGLLASFSTADDIRSMFDRQTDPSASECFRPLNMTGRSDRVSETYLEQEYSELEEQILVTNSTECVVNLMDCAIDMQVYTRKWDNSSEDTPNSLRTYYSTKPKRTSECYRLRNLRITGTSAQGAYTYVTAYTVDEAFDRNVLFNTLTQNMDHCSSDGKKPRRLVCVIRCDGKLTPTSNTRMAENRIELTKILMRSSHPISRRITFAMPFGTEDGEAILMPVTYPSIDSDSSETADICVDMCYSSSNCVLGKRRIGPGSTSTSSRFERVSAHGNSALVSIAEQLMEHYGDYLREDVFPDRLNLTHPKVTRVLVQAKSDDEGPDRLPQIIIRFMESCCECKQLMQPGARHSDFANGTYDVGCIYLAVNPNDAGYYRQKCFKCARHNTLPDKYELINAELKQAMADGQSIKDGKGFYSPGCGRSLRIPPRIKAALCETLRSL